MKKVIVSLLCVIGLMTAVSTVAAEDDSQYKKLSISSRDHNYRRLDLPKDSVEKVSRVTWSTNMVEWLIFAPNVGLEIDLKDPKLISCPSIFLQFSYRPGKEDFLKHENYTSSALYYWRARAEYRWHFRFNERREQRRGLGKTAMWLDESLFTKKKALVVPDTAAMNAGADYAEMTIYSKEARIQEKIDSTVTSTVERRSELFPGRYYFGLYGEYAQLTFNNKLIPVFGESLKTGPLYSLGFSGGYDFPGINYNHKCFLQWSVGASLGLLWYNYDTYTAGDASKDHPTATGLNRIVPFITELKVAMNFRNSTITHKYWRPDPSVYTKNLQRNHEDSIHMAELDTILEQKPVIIQVTSVNGFDSAFVENIDKFMVVNAFRQSTGLTYLLPTDFNMLEHTQEALDKKELSDNYFIEYVTTNRLRNYTDSVFISDRKNLPFRVEIKGRAEADSLKKSFVDSLKNYYAANNNSRPIFYGEPATRDSLKGYISKDSIAAQFSRIWGHPLDTSMIRTLYMAHNVTDEDGTFTTYYDSVITEQQINRGQAYAMFIQFHPQVTLSGEEEGVGRFRVAMAGADNAREQYNNTATFINKVARAGLRIRVPRPWDGTKTDTLKSRVTKEEVFAILEHYGMTGVDERNVIVSDSIWTYGGDSIIFNFGVTENTLTLPFSVEDSVGRARAYALYSDTIQTWKAESYWLPNSGLYDDDPKVPGYYDSISCEWYVNVDKFIEAVKDITFADLKPYMIDSITWRVQGKPYKTGQLAGKYRAQAYVTFHRELVAKSGKMMGTNIPYLIVPVETKEEAGWVEPKADVPAVDSVMTVRDSIVYVYDSIGNIIDSTIIQVESAVARPMIVTTRDSVAYVYDSLGNVIDSVVTQIEELVPAVQDTVVAEVVTEVKQLTVAEATEASKIAAAAAKAAAVEAKQTAAAAKKAKAAAAKMQKAADAAAKKAGAKTSKDKSKAKKDKTSKKPAEEFTTITRDSVSYTLDSIGNVIDSVVTQIEEKVPVVVEETATADSLADVVTEAVDSTVILAQAEAQRSLEVADSLQTVADQAAAAAVAAKQAAAEAKAAIAQAKAAEKAAAAEAKKKAKEEAAAAKAAAKEAKAAASGKKSKKKAEAEEAVEQSAEAVGAAVDSLQSGAAVIRENIEATADSLSQSAETTLENTQVAAQEAAQEVVEEVQMTEKEKKAAAKKAAAEAKKKAKEEAAALKAQKKAEAAAAKKAAAEAKKKAKEEAAAAKKGGKAAAEEVKEEVQEAAAEATEAVEAQSEQKNEEQKEQTEESAPAAESSTPTEAPANE